MVVVPVAVVGLPAVGDSLTDAHAFAPTHGKRVFGNTMGRRNGLDSKQSVALLRLDPTALAVGFDLGIYGGAIGDARSVVDDLLVRRQGTVIKPMGKRVDLRVVDDLFVRRQAEVIKPTGKRVDLRVVDGFFVRRQEEAIKPIAIGVGPIFVADALPAALAIGHFCIIANPVFFQGVVPGFIVIDLVCVNRLMGRDGWGEATD